MKYQGLIWKILWKRDCVEFYRKNGTYKGLPRWWEMSTTFWNEMGRGSSPIVSFYRALKYKWII